MKQETLNTEEIKQVRQLISQHIDDFKSMMLLNMRLDEKTAPTSNPLEFEKYRFTRFENTMETEGETLEQWVAKQKIKAATTKSTPTILDKLEKWLMNEAKKDLFAEIDAAYGNPDQLSSDHIREIAVNLLALADKLDRTKYSGN